MRENTLMTIRTSLVSEVGDNYGQISDELRRRLVLLKQRVADKVNRIKVLQNTIRGQVGELKHLEVRCRPFSFQSWVFLSFLSNG